MSLCTVSELRSALGVGTLYPDATLQSSCDAADKVLLPMLWSNDNFNIAHSASDDQRTLYFENVITDQFYVGEAIVVSGNDALFNGTYTINKVSGNSISYTHEESGRERPYHLVLPYGMVVSQDDVDYSLDPAIQEAALLLAVDIWQSRTTSNSGGVSPDFQPSPYRMGNTLLARVRGLIAHALDPRSMIG